MSSSGITVDVKICLQECNINARNIDKKLLCIIVAIRFWRVPSVMSLTLLYIVIARSVSDVAIAERDSFASLGMTHVGLFVGQDTR